MAGIYLYQPAWRTWYNDGCETAMFGSIGPTELILIFIIALLVFGPKKLPEIGKSVGRAIREFKKASDEIKGRIEEEIQASEIKDIGKDLQSGVNSLRDEIKGIADVSGMTELKNEIKGGSGPTPPPNPYEMPEKESRAGSGPGGSSQAGSQDPQKDIKKDAVDHETGEGPEISG
jgi:TatA/E family protein of Tat protein translocase